MPPPRPTPWWRRPIFTPVDLVAVVVISGALVVALWFGVVR